MSTQVNQILTSDFDPYLKARVIVPDDYQPQPLAVIYAAARGDYLEGWNGDPEFFDQLFSTDSSLHWEKLKGMLLKSNHCPHFGPFEHPSVAITFKGVPHSVMQQIRTHRIGLCLSGDTMIRFGHPSVSYGEKTREYRLSDLADLWHNGRKHQRTQSDADYMKRQISSRHIHVLDTRSNKLCLSHISNIYVNGVKPVVKVISSDGASIRCTKDHKFWTNQGWLKVADFNSETKIGRLQIWGTKRKPEIVEFSQDEIDSEEWKEVVDYPYYQVSTLGRVRSFMPRGGRGNRSRSKVLTPTLKTLSKGQYLYSSFTKAPGDGRSDRINIHHLVAKTFRPSNENEKEVRHLNANKYDNRLCNLTWGTSQENSNDLVGENEQAANRCEFFSVSIVDTGETVETYDIEVAHPEHNFIGNGFVTHNSFDVQSFRYTGKRIVDWVDQHKKARKFPERYVFPDIEELVYLRPPGEYNNPGVGKYLYDAENYRSLDCSLCRQLAEVYAEKIGAGMAGEHARGTLPFDTRQNLTISGNPRSFSHLLDVRAKGDVQLEGRAFIDLMLNCLLLWCPEYFSWYSETRKGKAPLTP